MAEGVALRIFAAELVEFDRIGLGLGAFGDDLHAEIVRQGHHRAQDHRLAALRGGVVDEGAVDLDRVEGEALEIGQRRITGAEIVQCEAGPEIADARQDLRRIFRILHHQALGQFELETTPAHIATRQHSFDVVQQVVTKQLA